MSSIEPLVSLTTARRPKGSVRRRALMFAGGLAVVFVAIGLWARLRGDSPRIATALFVFAGVFVAYAAVHPAGALAVRTAWLRFGGLLGRINSVILLTLLYAVLVVPLGLLSRLFGGKSFRAARGATYFKARAAATDPKRFERPY